MREKWLGLKFGGFFFFWGSNVQQLNLGWMDEYGLSGTLAQIQNASKWTATTKYILYREARKLKREKQFEFNSKWQPQSWFVICYCPSDLSFFLTKFITSPFIFLFYQPKSLLIYLFIYLFYCYNRVGGRGCLWFWPTGVAIVSSMSFRRRLKVKLLGISPSLSLL